MSHAPFAAAGLYTSVFVETRWERMRRGPKIGVGDPGRRFFASRLCDSNPHARGKEELLRFFSWQRVCCQVRRCGLAFANDLGWEMVAVGLGQEMTEAIKGLRRFRR